MYDKPKCLTRRRENSMEFPYATNSRTQSRRRIIGIWLAFDLLTHCIEIILIKESQINIQSFVILYATTNSNICLCNGFGWQFIRTDKKSVTHSVCICVQFIRSSIRIGISTFHYNFFFSFDNCFAANESM